MRLKKKEYKKILEKFSLINYKEIWHLWMIGNRKGWKIGNQI